LRGREKKWGEARKDSKVGKKRDRKERRNGGEKATDFRKKNPGGCQLGKSTKRSTTSLEKKRRKRKKGGKGDNANQHREKEGPTKQKKTGTTRKKKKSIKNKRKKEKI